jgi:hypothetical protein
MSWSPKAGKQHPPAAGAHNFPAEEAKHTLEAWPGSNSPGPRGHSNEITSGQPASRGPWHSTSSEGIHESLRKPKQKSQ